jgi:6-pyruvoyltetrahydropterin/6-carboxytetrahydropterin synthase
MYRVEKTLEIAGAHQLTLPYPSRCCQVHGHNWKIRVVCERERLNGAGMVIDFSEIGTIVKELDHQLLNQYINQPTAERIALYIAERLGDSCIEVEVQESEGNKVCYTR